MSAPYWKKTEDIYTSAMPRHAKDLLRYFLHRADFKTGTCDPSLATIAAQASMGKDTVLRAREWLRTHGHLTWAIRRIADRQNDTTEYRLAPQWVVASKDKGGSRIQGQKHTTTARRRKPKSSIVDSPRFDASAPPDRRCPICGAASIDLRPGGYCFLHAKAKASP